MSASLSLWWQARTARPIGLWIFVAGSLMTLGFAPFNLWPIALLSLALFHRLVMRASSLRQAAGAALVWGLGHQLTALYWIPWAFYRDGGDSLAAALGGGIPATLGLALYGTLVYVAVAVVTRLLAIRAPDYAETGFVATWLLLEIAKGLTPMGFPWLPLGAMWANWLPLLQLASLGSVHFISFILLCLAILLDGFSWRRWAWAALVIAACTGFGLLRLQAMVPDVSGERVRVIQPNVQSQHKWDPEKRREILATTMAIALNDDNLPATLVMPETAVPFYLELESDIRDGIASSLPPSTTLVTGTVRRDEDPQTFMPRFYNSIATLDDTGALNEAYDKRLLVPFGEYIPGRALLDLLPLPGTLRTLSASRIDYTHGSRDPQLKTPAGTAVGLICYEGIFPLFVASHAHGARYLLNITNDNWFTGTIALYQHASLARLRAVETGLPLVRAANTGISLVYDGYGRPVLRLPINTPAAADIRLPATVGPTVFSSIIETFFTP